MKKKILIFSLVFCFVFLTIGVFSSKKVIADEATIEMVPGAAIRTSEINPGIRFAANISGDFSGEASYGFLLVKGKYTKDEILRKYQNNPSNVAVVSATPYGNRISVAIHSIPEAKYDQDITVLAYASDGGEYIFSSATCTRNIFEVAKAAKADPEYVTNDFIDGIASKFYSIFDAVDGDLGDWEIRKYDSGWVSTSASLTKSTDYKGDTSLVVNAWDNQIAFRYGINYDVAGAQFNAIKFTYNGNGYTTIKVQLSRADGVYATYELGTCAEGYNDYIVSMDDASWNVNIAGNNYTAAQAKAYLSITSADIIAQFTILRFIFSGNNSNKSFSSQLNDIVFSPDTSTTGHSAVVHNVPRINLLTLDFEEWSGSEDLTGKAAWDAKWTNQKYTTSWVSGGTMRSRTKNASKVVNMTSGSSTTYKYTFNYGSSIGVANYFSIDLGNYFDGAADAQVKVALIDMSGNPIYVLGSSSEFAVIGVTTGLDTYTKSFGDTEVQGFYITFKSSLGSAFLYMDNVVIAR